MKITSIFKKNAELAAYRSMRDDLAAGFAVQAVRDSASTGISDKMADRVWARIDAEFSTAAMTSPGGRSTQPQRWFLPFILVPPLVLCGALAFYVFQVEPRRSEFLGIKSAGEAVRSVAEIKNLRFAILQPDGKLLTGEKNMRVSAGQQIIFSVDAEGVSASNPLQVKLSYLVLESGKSELIANASLTENRQVLAGKEGYFAFTPEETGNYRLKVVADGPGPDEKENYAEISIQVVAPD